VGGLLRGGRWREVKRGEHTGGREKKDVLPGPEGFQLERSTGRERQQQNIQGGLLERSERKKEKGTREGDTRVRPSRSITKS